MHAVVAILLGWLGIHKYLQGNTTQGHIRLALGICTLGIVTWPIGLIEGIQYLTMDDQEYDRVYLRGKKDWF